MVTNESESSYSSYCDRDGNYVWPVQFLSSGTFLDADGDAYEEVSEGIVNLVGREKDDGLASDPQESHPKSAIKKNTSGAPAAAPNGSEKTPSPCKGIPGKKGQAAVSKIGKPPSQKVKAKSHSVNSAKFKMPKLELWPEQVDGVTLLDDLTAKFRHYLALPDGAAETMALWVVFTHAFDAADVSPRLALLSPVPECGKTTALSLIGRLVPRPLLASNLSPAVVFRATESLRPTLLMDEADTYMEQRDEFRGILNSGHTPDTAVVWRCVGDDHEPRSFTTWAPMAIAKIGKLPPTLASRSIIVPMRRKRRDENVERFRIHRDGGTVAELAQKAARWARDNLESLKGADPEMPEALSNRAADNWRPLLAIADAAGGEWSDKTRTIAVMLSGDEAEPTPEVEFLADICDILDKLDKWDDGSIKSADLCRHLNSKTDQTWRVYIKGPNLSAVQLAAMLRPFGIKPHTFREGDRTPKGYRIADFQDAFARYLPEKRNTETSEENQ